MPDLGEDGRNGAEARRLTKTQRRHQILELKKAGASHEDISVQLEISVTTVAAIYKRALKELTKLDTATVDELRTIEVARLDEIMLRLWPKVTRADPDQRAIDRILKVMERRARLLGLDAPQKVNVGGQVDLTHFVDREELERLDQAWMDAGGGAIEGEATELPPGPKEAGDAEARPVEVG